MLAAALAPHGGTVHWRAFVYDHRRDWRDRTGQVRGVKPAGGIRTAKQALDWLILMKEELGTDWMRPNLFRIGASSLLTDIERQLEYFVTGRYSAGYRHPMP